MKILRPAFVNPLENQLSSEDWEFSRSIAIARVHVEHPIQRLKNFNVLHEEVTFNMLDMIDNVVHVDFDYGLARGYILLASTQKIFSLIDTIMEKYGSK